jgi:hypothetical protein
MTMILERVYVVLYTFLRGALYASALLSCGTLVYTLIHYEHILRPGEQIIFAIVIVGCLALALLGRTLRFQIVYLVKLGIAFQLVAAVLIATSFFWNMGMLSN